MDIEKMKPLIQQAIQRDEAAYSELCRQTGKNVLYMCMKYMRHTQDGEDAAQEVFYKMQKTIGQLKDPCAFPVWLNRLVLSVCNDLRRKSMKLKDTYSIDDHVDILPELNMEFLPQSYAEDQELRNTLMQVMEEIPSRYYTALMLYYFEGLSHEEIAQVMECSKSAVNHMLQRGRDSIRKRLEKRTGEKLSPVLGMAAVPVLTRAFTADAGKIITPELLQSVLAGSKLAASAAASPGAGAAAGAVNGVIVKVAAVVTAMLILVGSSVLGVSMVTNAAPPLTYAPTHSLAAAPVVEVPQPYVEECAAGNGLDRSAPESEALESALAPNAEKRETPPALSESTTNRGDFPAATLTGRVAVCDKTGETVNAVLPEGGLTVLLMRGDTQLGSAPVQPGGGYAFSGIGLQPQEKYELVLQVDGNSGFIAGLPVEFTAAGQPQQQLPGLYVTDVMPPTIAIAFYSQSGAVTTVNPHSIEISVGDNAGANCEWKIVDAKTGEIFDTGDTTTIPAEKFMEKLPKGKEEFAVEVTAADFSGNSTTARQIFYILVDKR